MKNKDDHPEQTTPSAGSGQALGRQAEEIVRRKEALSSPVGDFQGAAPSNDENGVHPHPDLPPSIGGREIKVFSWFLFLRFTIGDLVKSQLFSSLSFLRRQESSLFNGFWIPVFTGMTR
jgi:hypothetical protein